MVKDLDLFRRAMADVSPLKGRRAPVAGRSTSTRPPEERQASAVATTVRKTVAPAEAFSFDRDIDRALSRGRRDPEAKLDLHGLTLTAAERAVARFLEEATALDLRVVLV